MSVMSAFWSREVMGASRWLEARRPSGDITTPITAAARVNSPNVRRITALRLLMSSLLPSQDRSAENMTRTITRDQKDDRRPPVQGAPNEESLWGYPLVQYDSFNLRVRWCQCVSTHPFRPNR